MIIFNEKDYAERVIKNNCFQTLKYQGLERRAVAKYLKYEKGYSEDHIKEFITNIKSKRKELYDEEIWDSIMNKLIINYDKTEYLYDIEVHISQSELDIVLSQPTLELRNLLFVLLVYYKWASQTKDRSFIRRDAIWVREADMECCKMAHLDKLKRDERILLFGELYQSGLYSTDYVRKYRDIFTLNFIDEGTPIIIIKDFHDILAYLENYIDPNNCIHCSQCNSLICKTGRNHKMCSSCRNNRKHQKAATLK